MAIDYTVDALLEGAKVRANHPTTGGRPTDSEILRMANGALLGVMTSRLMAAVQAELGAETTIPIVKGTAKYALPQRAAGPKIRYLCVSDGSNNRYAVTIAPAERWIYQNPGLGSGGGSPYGAYLENNNIVLVPTPTASGYNLVVGYYQRPNQMVLKSACAVLTANAAAGATILNVANSSSQLPDASGKVDIVGASPHFSLSNIDLLVGANDLTTLGVPALTAAASQGDWVCPANLTCVVPLPVEIQPLLEVRTAMAILRAKNDHSGLLDTLLAEASELEDQLYTFFSNRVENSVDTLGSNSLMDSFGTSGYATRNGLF